MKLDRVLSVIDIEATGLDPQKDRIIEFGVDAIHPHTTERKRWCQRFNPGIPIPPESTEIHGITDAMVSDCPPFSQLAPMILKGLMRGDIGGYNLWRFDLVILDEELRRCGLKLDLTGIRVIDAYGIYAAKDPRDLSAAVRRFCKREPTGAHGAQGDATDTADVIISQVAEFDDLSAMSLDELAAFSKRSDKAYADLARRLYIDQDGHMRYAFGKHVDQKVEDYPDFAAWMLYKADFPGSTCDALLAECRRLFPADNERGWRY